MDKITVAVPCYNEEPVLDLFYSAITGLTDKLRAIRTGSATVCK